MGEERERVGDGGEKVGGRRGRGREIGGIRVCVRDLKSQGWERREGARGRESRWWEREHERE